MRSLVLLCAVAVVMLCSACLADELVGDIEKELQYVDALVERGVEAGDMKLLQRAHRTLANLDVTSKGLGRRSELAAVRLAISFFYIRMSDSALLLSLSKTTNPVGFVVDPIRESEHYFHAALETARGAGDKKLLADTYFFVGIGYDFLRGKLSGLPGADRRALYEKARAHIEKSLEIGTSFPGAYTLARRLYRYQPDSRETVIDAAQFTELHTLLYLQASIPRVAPPLEKSKVEPIKKDENTFIDYKWRLSVKRVDTSWEFAPAVSKTSFKLLVRRVAGKPKAGSGVQITARPLDEGAGAGASEEEVVNNSVSLLKTAGFRVDEQKKIQFKGKTAHEVLMTHEAASLGEGGPGKTLESKLYMLIVVSSGIQYVLSFNAMSDEFESLRPDLMEIVNSFTPF